MPDKQRQILDGLNLELHYLEKGGYELSPRQTTHKERSIFLDSPLCLNVLPVEGTYPAECPLFPCSRCWLIDFVPADRRYEAVPCHHIPLNEQGDTIAAMDKPEDDLRVQETVRSWLLQKKQEFEETPAKHRHAAA